MHMVSFLRTVFGRALLVTTHIENAFASMRTHLTKGMRAPVFTTVAARHVLKEVLRCWFDAMRHAKLLTPAARASRPVWVQSKKQRTGVSEQVNSWMLFVGERAQQDGAGYGSFGSWSEEWTALAPDEKAKYQSQAAGKRAIGTQAGLLCDPLRGVEHQAEDNSDFLGPLGLGDKDHVVSTQRLDAVNDETNGLKSRSVAFRARVGSVLEAGVAIPKAIPFYTPCGPGACSAGWDADELARTEDIVDTLETIMAPRGTSPVLGVMPFLAVVADANPDAPVFVVCGPARKNPFMAELFELLPCSEEPSLDPPFDIQMCGEDMGPPLNIILPVLSTEVQFARKLIDSFGRSPLRFHNLEVHYKDMLTYTVTSSCVIDVDALREQQRLNHMTEEATKAFQKASEGLFVLVRGLQADMK